MVCGLPRSGTTLIGALLNQSPAIEVLNEIPYLSEFPGFRDLIRQYCRWCDATRESAHEAWRGMSADVVEERVEGLLRAFSRALKPFAAPGSPRWDAGEKPDAPVFCLKRPGLELWADAYEELFTERKPRYVYCLRDPVEIYGSMLSVPWGAAQTPEDFVASLGRSIARIEELARAGSPNRTFIVNVERASRNPEERQVMVQALFKFIGVEPCDRVARFVSEWPPTNRSQQYYEDRRFVEDTVREERVRRLRRLLAGDRALTSAVIRLLESGPG